MPFKRARFLFINALLNATGGHQAAYPAAAPPDARRPASEYRLQAAAIEGLQPRLQPRAVGPEGPFWLPAKAGTPTGVGPVTFNFVLRG